MIAASPTRDPDELHCLAPELRLNTFTHVCATQEVCSSNPNQRKVFAAVVAKLLPHLLAAAFGSRQAVLIPAAVNGQSQLSAAARRVLDTVIFHGAHIHGLRLSSLQAMPFS